MIVKIHVASLNIPFIHKRLWVIMCNSYAFSIPFFFSTDPFLFLPSFLLSCIPSPLSPSLSLVSSSIISDNWTIGNRWGRSRRQIWRGSGYIRWPQRRRRGRLSQRNRGDGHRWQRNGRGSHGFVRVTLEPGDVWRRIAVSGSVGGLHKRD